jgi:hypothetical protein
MEDEAMSVIRTTATAGPDGVLHLSVPAGRPGEYDVQVVIVPRAPAKTDAPASGPTAPKTPEELGWPPGFFENVIGSIDDEAFVAPPRPPAEPLPPLDLE